MKRSFRCLVLGVLLLCASSAQQAQADGKIPAIAADSISLRGIAVDEKQKPIAGAKLQVYLSGCNCGPMLERREIGAAKSNGQGRFVLQLNANEIRKARRKAASDDLKISLLASAPGRAMAVREYSLSQLPHVIALSLPRERIVAGRVFDLQGRAVAGATVSVTSLNRRADLLSEDSAFLSFAPRDNFLSAKTNARGEFQVRGLPLFALVRLFVAPPQAGSTPSLAAMAVQTSTDSAKPPAIRVDLPRAAHWSGRVLLGNSRRPAANTVVRCWTGEFSRETVTDTRGAFAFSDLPPGKITVFVEAPPFQKASFMDMQREIALRAARNAPAELRLEPGVLVRGLARDKDTQKPLGAWIHAYRSPDASALLGDDKHAFFSAPIAPDGTWKMAMAPGRYTFQVFGLPPDYVAPEELDETGLERAVDARKPTPPIVFEFSAVKPLKIQVVNAGGQPVAGARVLALYDKKVFTDARGVAILRGAKPQQEILVVGPANAMASAATVSADKSRVLLLPAAFATGQVLDERGRPIEGALVSAMAHFGSMSWNSSFAVSGRDGRYELPLAPAANYSFDVTASGFGGASIKKIQTHSATTSRLETVRLPRADLEITGVVLNSAGKPVSGASVTASQNPHNYLQEKTDGQGRFRFKGLAAGEARISVFTSTIYAEQTLSVQAGTQNLRLVLPSRAKP